MKYSIITAIIQPFKLELVEEKIKKLCVSGISVTNVHGYGEARNYFNNDWTSAYARIEIFIEANRAQEVAQAIIDTAHTGKEDDGIVAILPVESLYQIHTKKLL